MTASRRPKRRDTDEGDRVFKQAWKLLDGGRARAGFRAMKAAAELGDRGAEVEVGNCYDVGLGTRRSRALAMRWYHRAARHGESSGAANIGMIYRDAGRLALAMRWFKRAASMGLEDCWLDVAKIYAQRPSGRRRRLAQRALIALLSCSEITEANREEGERLLLSLTSGNQ